MFGDEWRNIGIALQAPDVVDDGRALVERPGCNRSLDGIDRHRQAELDDLRQDRRQPRLLIISRYRHWITVGPRRFRTDIQNVGALLGHFSRVRDRHSGVHELTAVREGIRRHIEDAHDQRPAERKQGRKCV